MTGLTALGQPSTDSVTISRDQQRDCIKWYYDSKFKDSIIIFKDSIIITQSDFIKVADNTVISLDKTLTTTKNKLDGMRKKRNRSFVIGGIATIASFFVGLFVF